MNTEPNKVIKAETRLCSYDPNRDVLKLKYEDTGREELYLPVNGRVTWFNIYCQENGLSGRIEESEISLHAEFGLATAVSRIFINDELVSDGTAGVSFVPGDMAAAETKIQTVATRAKGRALSNAGFNISSREEGSDLLPCDSGVTLRVNGGHIVAESDNPLVASFVSNDESEGEEEDLPFFDRGDPSQPCGVPPASTEPPTQPRPAMALEEARKYVFKTGAYVKGKTVAQAMGDEKGQGMVKFYAGYGDAPYKYKDRNPDLVQACRLVWEDFIAK